MRNETLAGKRLKRRIAWITPNSEREQEEDKMPDNSHKVHAVEKAIALLDCFWRVRRPMSLTELSRSTGWPKSTVHNLLASMIDSAVVEQSPADGKYRLGLHLFEYGCVISEHWNVVKLARPHLNALVAKTGNPRILRRSTRTHC